MIASSLAGRHCKLLIHEGNNEDENNGHVTSSFNEISTDQLEIGVVARWVSFNSVVYLYLHLIEVLQTPSLLRGSGKALDAF